MLGSTAAASAADVPKAADVPAGAERRKPARGRRRPGSAARCGASAPCCSCSAFLFVYLTPDVLITVKSGEVGVLYRRLAGGTQIDSVTRRGLTFVAPWDRLFICNVRVQECKHRCTC